MTPIQIEALIQYIEASLEAALDDNKSSDEGTISAIKKTEAEERLKTLLS